MVKPKLRQAVITMIEGSAVASVPSQSGPSTPARPSSRLTSPASGSSRNFQATAMPMMLVMLGR